MSEELHRKLLGFLAGEFARQNEAQCVSVELVFAPHGAVKNEQLREWRRAQDPGTFEIGTLPDFVTSVIDIAESETDAKPPGKYSFFLRTKQYMGGQQKQSFSLQPSFSGSDESVALTSSAPRQDGSAQALQVMTGFANTAMRTNTQMFDGSLRALGAANERLSNQNADLHAENIILRREIEDARTNKLDKEFQIAMAADKNARANAGWQKFMQIGTVLVAKMSGGIGGLGGAGGADNNGNAGAVAAGPAPWQMLISEFANSLRQDQQMTLFNMLDTSQKIMFQELMTMAMQGQSNGAPQPPPNGQPSP